MRPTTFSAWVFATLAILMLIAGLLMSRAANAGEAALTWTNPTLNVDGSAIPASGTGALNGNRVEWGTCSGTAFGTFIGQMSWTAPRTSYTVTGLTPGAYCFRAFAKTQYGESDPSNVASKTLTPPLPAPPSNLTVVNLQVYTVIKQKDRFVLLPVGTVPADTPCDPAQSVNGMNAVPRDAVQWTGTVQDDVVVARCG